MFTVGQDANKNRIAQKRKLQGAMILVIFEMTLLQFDFELKVNFPLFVWW